MKKIIDNIYTPATSDSFIKAFGLFMTTISAVYFIAYIVLAH
jgi:hypothetical protein